MGIWALGFSESAEFVGMVRKEESKNGFYFL